MCHNILAQAVGPTQPNPWYLRRVKSRQAELEEAVKKTRERPNPRVARNRQAAKQIRVSVAAERWAGADHPRPALGWRIDSADDQVGKGLDEDGRVVQGLSHMKLLDAQRLG